MTGRGNCLSSHHSHHVNYTFVFLDEQTTCYHCVKFFVRTVNILDKVECELQLFNTTVKILILTDFSIVFIIYSWMQNTSRQVPIVEFNM